MAVSIGAGRRAIVGLVMVFLIPAYPAAATDPTAPPVELPPGMHSTFRIPKEAQGFVRAEERADATGRYTYVWATPWDDLNRDGVRDVVVEEIYNDPTPGEPTKYTIRAYSGRNGKLLFRYRDSAKAGYAYLLPAKLGPKGRNGVIAVVWEGVTSYPVLISEMKMRFVAINAKGKRLWRQRHEATLARVDNVTVYKDVPVALDSFDGLKGRQTELLLGTSTIAGVQYDTVSAADTTVAAISGKNGSVHPYPDHEIGVNWVPEPWAVGDMDERGGDDYVVTNRDRPVRTDEGSLLPAKISDEVKARSGRDGSVIWTSGGYEFGGFAWVFPLPDVTGDRRPDLAINTLIEDEAGAGFVGAGFQWKLVSYLVDGVGAKRWRRPGGWPHSPGDIDRRGARDVVLMDMLFWWSMKRVGYRFAAYRSDGDRLWRKNVIMDLPDRPRTGLGAGFGAWPVGDLHPDGVDDIFATLAWQDDLGGDQRNDMFDLRKGRVVRSRGADYLPLAGSVDGRGTDASSIHWELPGDLAVEVRDGRTDRRYWTSALRFNVPINPDSLSFWPIGTQVDKRGHADVVLVVSASASQHVVALDGCSGKILWSRTIEGKRATITRSRSDRGRSPC